jgi:hypothetical protein
MKHKMAAWLRALLSAGLLAGLISSGGLITLVGSGPAVAGLSVLDDVPADPQVFLPAVFKLPEPTPGPPSDCGGTWDPRLDELGVYLEPAVRAPGEAYWCLFEGRWADEEEAAGLHHIFLDAVDANDNRVYGQEMVVEWPGDSVTVVIEKAPPEYGANVGMYATLGSYSVRVGGGQPSDRVVGMGLGTPEQPDFTIHTCFFLTFKWVP